MVKHIGAIKLPVNRLHMELTNACNFSCEFCPDAGMKRERGMMPVYMAKSILDQVSAFGGIRMVLFHVMGEPTLHPDLLEIAEYASSKNVTSCVTTNGSLLSRDMVYDLQKAGVRNRPVMNNVSKRSNRRRTEQWYRECESERSAFSTPRRRRSTPGKELGSSFGVVCVAM